MDLEHLETFALGDRKKALEALVPGTEDSYYYQCLHHEHEGELDEVNALLDAWIERHGRTPRVEEVDLRHTLLTLDQEPRAGCDYLTTLLDVHFEHAAEVE